MGKAVDAGAEPMYPEKMRVPPGASHNAES